MPRYMRIWTKGRAISIVAGIIVLLSTSAVQPASAEGGDSGLALLPGRVSVTPLMACSVAS